MSTIGGGAVTAEVAHMTEKERVQALASISVTSREQLLQFLHESERDWIILNAKHLVEAIPFPEGVRVVQQIVAWYRDYRAQVGTGRKMPGKHPITGEPVEVEDMHGETLEIREAEHVIRFLLDMIRSRDPTWTLARL